MVRAPRANRGIRYRHSRAHRLGNKPRP